MSAVGEPRPKTIVDEPSAAAALIAGVTPVVTSCGRPVRFVRRTMATFEPLWNASTSVPHEGAVPALGPGCSAAFAGLTGLTTMPPLRTKAMRPSYDHAGEVALVANL